MQLVRIPTLVAVAGVVILTARSDLFAASIYLQTNLASDVPGMAPNLDPNLKNPWGVSFTNTSPFWVSNQVTNTSTLYNGAGTPQALIVTTPPSPTGQVANGTTDFLLSPGNPARFIFAGLSGTISGWNPTVAATSAVTEFTAPDGAVYTGLTMATVGTSNFLYAADSRNGKIDTLNGSFVRTNPAGSFIDPALAPGFKPYNVQTIGNRVYVTYSIRDNPGGYVGIFDLTGGFIQQISDSHLDEPWGLTIAPAGFGSFGNALLVGNEGDGMINGFDPVTGAWLGTISGASGPIVNDGLWALEFRSSTSGFNANALYFVAGINDEKDGLFGTITVAAVPEPGTVWTVGLAMVSLACITALRRRSQSSVSKPPM